MADPKRDVPFWVNHIGNHNFDKHVTEKKEFTDPSYGPDQKVESKEQYKEHATDNLENKDTVGFVGDNAREIYYNKETNSATILNNQTPSESTHFRPADKEQWFNRNYEIEKGRLEDKGKDITSPLPGGYYALHPEKGVERSQSTQATPSQTVSARKSLSDYERKPSEPDKQQAAEKRPGERLIDRYTRSFDRDDRSDR